MIMLSVVVVLALTVAFVTIPMNTFLAEAPIYLGFAIPLISELTAFSASHIWSIPMRNLQVCMFFFLSANALPIAKAPYCL